MMLSSPGMVTERSPLLLLLLLLLLEGTVERPRAESTNWPSASVTASIEDSASVSTGAGVEVEVESGGGGTDFFERAIAKRKNLEEKNKKRKTFAFLSLIPPFFEL